MDWLAHILGVDDPSGGWYLFWSGFGADLGLFSGAAIYLRHRNCHERGCWRLGRLPLGDTNFVVCRKHHPSISTGEAQ